MKLRVHMIETEVTALGFGNRFCVWTQGCLRRCPGCVAPDAQPLDGGDEITCDALAWEIILSGTEGLTISGGEPMLQARALCELIRKVKLKKNIGVIVYTGYVIEELTSKDQKELLALSDVIIDGEYVSDKDDGKSLRGSVNQRIICLTGRYRGEIEIYSNGERLQEKRSYGSEIREIGIPSHIKTKGSINK